MPMPPTPIDEKINDDYDCPAYPIFLPGDYFFISSVVRRQIRACAAPARVVE